MKTVTPAPRRLTWAIAGRLVRGVAVAFALVWLAGLVAWPAVEGWCEDCILGRAWRRVTHILLAREREKPPSHERDTRVEFFEKDLREVIRATVHPCQHPDRECPTREASLSLLPDLLGM